MTNNNTTPKRYRLKKDVLNYSTGQIISSGEVFSNIEGTRKYISQSGWYMSEAACLRKDWFEEVEEIKEPERIEVTVKEANYGLSVEFSKQVPEVHFPAIKESLEKVLNDSPVFCNGVKDEYNGERLFPESYIDKARREAFEAARLTHPVVGVKFATYEEYINSIK